MKFLVTGANGFVGSHLCQELLEKGHEVRAAVRTPGSADPKTEEYVIQSMDDQSDWRAALNGVDVVVHLAARVHVMSDNSPDPLAEFRRTNVTGTQQLASQCKEAGIGKFVYMSSIKVNGELTTNAPFTVHSIPKPVDAYGISKHEAELSLAGLADANFSPIIIRTPMIYGPGVGGNFQRLMRLAEKNIIVPFGLIRNRRTLLSVRNLCDLVLYCAQWQGHGLTHVIAGDAESPSTPELFKTLAKLSNRKAKIMPIPVKAIKFGGRLIGRSSEVSRLTDSLEITTGSDNPNFRWSPPYDFKESIRCMAKDVG